MKKNSCTEKLPNPPPLKNLMVRPLSTVSVVTAYCYNWTLTHWNCEKPRRRGVNYWAESLLYNITLLNSNQLWAGPAGSNFVERWQKFLLRRNDIYSQLSCDSCSRLTEALPHWSRANSRLQTLLKILEHCYLLQMRQPVFEHFINIQHIILLPFQQALTII